MNDPAQPIATPVVVTEVPAPVTLPDPSTTIEPPVAQVLQVPTAAMTKIKAEERERGKKMHNAEMNRRAQALGFKTWEDMEAEMARKKARATRGAAPVATPKPATRTAPREPEIDPNDPDAEAKRRSARRREKERYKEQLRVTSRARAQEERKRKEAEKRVASLEVEMQLKTVAIQHGVKDVDYSIELLRRELRAMDPAKRASFDEKKFFSDKLRNSHPYLYGTIEAPAHTAPTPIVQQTTATPATTPTPATKPTQATGPNGTLDARKLTPDEYSALLKKHGLTNPSAGF
jgi:hypothetical protein